MKLKNCFGNYFENIIPNFRIFKVNQKYFLEYNVSFSTRKHKEINKNRIKETISKICAIFEKKINPDLITICRSVYSEYTNVKYLKFIEKEFIRKLEKIYDANQIDVNEFPLKPTNYCL